MPIYEYYCRENHTIYQFYAKTLAQGALIPKCPDNPAYSMEKMVSAFAITGGRGDEPSQGAGPADPEQSGEDQRMEAALGAMEREFSSIDENDPKAMGRMMRRMAELTGERIDGEMEEVVRKLEEGMDPEKLDEQFGEGDDPAGTEDEAGAASGDREAAKPARQRLKSRRPAPVRDPKLYDY